MNVNMPETRPRVLFLFVDGIGLGPEDESNPLAQTRLPTLEGLVDERWLAGLERSEPRLVARGVDACLGVAGLPQSATGQTALLTGINAAQVAGMHMPAFPVSPLTQLLAEQSVFKRARALGARVTSANAYRKAYWQRSRPRHAATTLALMAAGIPFRTEEDLRAGRAVYWDITHEVARASLAPDFPKLSPQEAGRRLARLTQEYDLVFFETFLPDLVGHGRVPWPAERVLRLLDAFLAGVLMHMGEEVTLILVSDHGNLEDARTRGHTRNPALFLAYGPVASAFSGVRDLTHVAPSLLDLFRK